MREIDEILEAVAATPELERARRIRELCGDDEELFAEVESLASHLPAAEQFLASPPEVSRTLIGQITTTHDARDRSGEVLGAWRLLRPLGEGGMGSVYLAERADGAFEKRAAIKLIRSRVGVDLEDRFLAERQTLAALEHPQIARLLDGGTSQQGEPFLVMEFVANARPIDQAYEQSEYSPEARIEHFLAVCAAVQYAHSKLVVHRDLKPSNVLLDGAGQVKLVDFGISKLLGEPTGPTTPEGEAALAGGRDLTIAGSAPMTPAYASPEQLRGDPVTTATDVFSLGVLLHVALTGRRPVGANGGSRVSEELDRDLRCIVARCLEEEPTERYASVGDLARDLRRYREHLPVSAVPQSWRYRAGKFWRRHRVAVSGAIAAFVLLLFATVISMMSFLRAESARIEAETERATAEQVSEFLGTVLGSIDPNVAQGRDISVLTEVIDQAAARIPEELVSQPKVAAALHETLGGAYKSLARLDDAEQQLRLALEHRERGGDPDLSATLVLLSRVLTEQSRHQEAEEVTRRAVQVAKRQFGGRSVEHSSALLAHGELLALLARQEEAEIALLAAEEVIRSLAPVPPLVLARVLEERGWLHATTGVEGRGEDLLRDALEIRRQNAQTAPLPLLNAIGKLAYSLRVQGKLEESRALYEEERSTARRLLGESHPRYAMALTQLASLLEFAGEYEDALESYQEALRVQRATLGDQHREVGTTRNNLGGLYRKMRRWPDAERELQAAEEIYRHQFGNDHAWVAIAVGNLLHAYLAQDRWPEVETGAAEYLRVARLNWPADHWRVRWYEGIEAACRLRRGAQGGALDDLRSARDAVLRELGEDHQATRQLKSFLVRFG